MEDWYDTDRVEKMYRQACKNLETGRTSYIKAKEYYSLAWESIDKVDKRWNLELAFYYVKRAAEQEYRYPYNFREHTVAKLQTGLMYAHGEGTYINEYKAFEWLREAAFDGLWRAQNETSYAAYRVSHQALDGYVWALIAKKNPQRVKSIRGSWDARAENVVDRIVIPYYERELKISADMNEWDRRGAKEKSEIVEHRVRSYQSKIDYRLEDLKHLENLKYWEEEGQSDFREYWRGR